MSAKKHHLLLGAHMSIAGGLEKAIIAGERIGCTTIQIFTKSNRQWNAKPISEQEAALFKTTAHQYKMGPIIAHATYLINIASPDSKTAHASVKALTEEVLRCQLLDIPYLVLHPWAFTSGDRAQSLEQVVVNLDLILDDVPGNTMILLETMAGQGSVLCSTFTEIALILSQAHNNHRLGVCMDTCHIFSAGYDIRTAATYQASMQEFERVIGLHRLKVIHVNDSKNGLNSRVDRHEHIGKGTLGLEPFRLLFNDERFFDIPKILETPKSDEHPLDDDSMNMATIKGLLTDKTKELLGVEWGSKVSFYDYNLLWQNHTSWVKTEGFVSKDCRTMHIS